MPEIHLSPSEAQDELRTACYDGDFERVSQLFANAPLDAGDATRALGNSLMEMDPTLIRALLQNGADISVVHIRAIPRSGRVSELLELLAQHNYDFKTNGHIILQDFARDQKTLDWLLDQGVDINRTDVQRLDDGFNLAPGETDWSLHLLNKVAADGDIALFDYLVSRGADVTLSTALHSASACESPELSRAMVCHLLDKYSMDINSNNDNFRDFIHDADDSGSPLCSAIINQNLGVVNELLQRGALPTEPDSYPASYAAKLFLPALEPLLHAGADPSEALRDAVAYSNVGAAKVCIGFGADPGHALQEALKKEERRVRSAVDAAAFIECTSDMDDEDYEKAHKEERVEEANSKAMIALLRSAMYGL